MRKIHSSSESKHFRWMQLFYVGCIAMLTLSILLFPRPAQAQWAATYGFGGVSQEVTHAVEQTSDGGFIVAGHTRSNPFIGNTLNFWVLKLDVSGSVQWQKIYSGSPDQDIPSAIQQTSDGGYIVAGSVRGLPSGTTSDFWVLKLDAAGTIQWHKTYGGSGNDSATCIQQTSDDGYVVAGNTSSFSVGNNDFWVLKLCPDGTDCNGNPADNNMGEIQWQKAYGGSGNDSATSIQQTSDDGYIVAGSTNSFGAGDSDFSVLKLCPDGTDCNGNPADNNMGEIQWQRTYGGSAYDGAESIQQAIDAGYIVAGSTDSFGTGLRDFWVLKLGSGGAVQWQTAYGGASNDSAYSIRQTSDEGYIVAGWTTHVNTTNDDFLILKLNSSGNVQWQKTFGGAQGEGAYSIGQTRDDGYIATGPTTSFGAGSTDFLVLKLKQDGSIDPTCSYVEDATISVIDSSATAPISFLSAVDSVITPETFTATIQDTGVSANILCQGAVEDCGNGFDDDGDELADCNDPECCEDPLCLSIPPCTALSETILSEQAVMHEVDVSGTYTSTLDFTSLEFISITTGAFAGKGFSKGACEITFGGTAYTGTWKGALFLKPLERRIYLKGVISEGITATVDGYLTESVQKSGIYDKYEATWIIGRLDATAVSATINLTGTVSYQNSTEYTGTALHFFQGNISTIDAGDYGDNLNAVITHLRVAAQDNPHYGEGFSTISYNADSVQGEGWTCDELLSVGTVQMKGLFSSPLFGIATATLDETKLPKTFALSIERVDQALPPMADLELDVFGPRMVSPGQTVNYIIAYRNDGASPADDVVVAGELPSLAEYLSSSAGGMYRSDTHEVLWKLGTVLPQKIGVLYVEVYFPWGLPARTTQRVLVKYGTSSVDKDYYLNPEWEPLFDLQEYLDYQPQQLEPKDIITAAEFGTELSSDIDFNDLYQYAIALGYTELVFPAKKTISGGTTITSAIMFNPSTNEILYLTRENDTSTLGQYTKNEISVFDRGGGMTYNTADGSVNFWGNWAPTIGLLETKRGVKGGFTTFSAPFKCTKDVCMRNCVIKKRAEYKKEKQLLALTCKNSLKESFPFIGIDAIFWCQPPEERIRISRKIYIDCWNASQSCTGGSGEYCCEESWAKCGNNDYSKDLDWIYILPCDPITHMFRFDIGYVKTKDCRNLGPPPADFTFVCGTHRATAAGFCLETIENGTLVGKCEVAVIHCGKNSRCKTTSSEICLPHDPNIKYGPAGPVEAGQKLDYTVEFENEGDGAAFGVYFTDVLDEDLNDSTLVIGAVKDITDDTEIAPAGTYDPTNRSITWFVGEVGPHEGGYAELSVNIRSDAPRGTEIINSATVYFPSVSEETRTNAIVSIIPIEICNDSIDNDEDTLIDCNDPDCFSPDCIENCNDGMDNDGDGWVDCADQDANCPSCPEECTNEIDDDMDGLVDCDDIDCPKATFYEDLDGDGFGNLDSSIINCIQAPVYVSNSADCDDNDSNINPGITEICDDLVDNNCNGLVDCEESVCEDDPTCLITLSTTTTTTSSSGGSSGGGGSGGGGSASTTTSTALECTSEADCDDGLFCNGEELCNTNQCVAGSSPCIDNEICDEINNICIQSPPPAECALDDDCDDSIFCNGTERCEDGMCVNGESPCDSGQICKEDSNECLDIVTISASCMPESLYRPFFREKRCPWLLVQTNEKNHFNLQSIITTEGSREDSRGVEVDLTRSAFKVGKFIFCPICIEKGATTGQWNIKIKTEAETIEASFQIK